MPIAASRSSRAVLGARAAMHPKTSCNPLLLGIKSKLAHEFKSKGREQYGRGSMIDAAQEAKLLGHVAWDGATATSERALLRANVVNRQLLERNQYVRIQDKDGLRSGFLA